MVFEKLKHIIIEQLWVEEENVTLKSSFVEDLSCDDLDLIELAMAVEDDFEIVIPDDEWFELKTVGEVIKYIEGKI